MKASLFDKSNIRNDLIIYSLEFEIAMNILKLIVLSLTVVLGLTQNLQTASS